MSVMTIGLLYGAATLLHEAWREGQTTTSSWGPPLWIPYSIMALGMTLVGIQLLLHLMARVAAVRGAR